jgi:hypothetical protein
MIGSPESLEHGRQNMLENIGARKLQRPETGLNPVILHIDQSSDY